MIFIQIQFLELRLFNILAKISEKHVRWNNFAFSFYNYTESKDEMKLIVR